MKVLAIDDVSENAILINELLLFSFPKAKFISANNGPSGIELCKNEMPDIIVLDIMMPGMDGYEVCKILKTDKKLKHIPILMMTAAHSEKNIRIKALDSGADAFLAKPFDESEFTAQIRSMMRIKVSEDRKRSEKKRLEVQVRKRTEELRKELTERKIAEAKLKLLNQELEISRKKSVKLTKKLRVEIKEKQHAEKKVKAHLKEQILISDFARQLVSLHTLEGVYNFIGHKISLIAQSAYVIVSAYNQDSKTIQKKYLFGYESTKDEFVKTFSKDPFSSEIVISDISNIELNNLKKRKLFELPPDGNYLIFDETLDRKSWSKTENILKIKSIFTIGFTWEDKLYGGISLLVKDQLSVDQIQLIETLVNQTSIVIQRLFLEQKLKQNEKLYRTLVETSPDGITMWDLDGNIIALNIKMIELFGYNDENEIRSSVSSILNLINSSDRKRALNDFSGQYSDKLTNQEYKATKKNGKEIIIEINSSMLSDNQDKTYGFISIIRDITDRKQVENALKESRELYKLLTDKMTDVVWLKDIKGKTIFVSPSVVKFTGFSVQEYLNQTLKERFASSSLANAEKIFEKELIRLNSVSQQTNYSSIAQLEYNCKDGGTKWGELVITPYYDERNVPIGIHGVIRDIDERKLIEKSLLESEEKYRLLADNMVDILSLFDISGRILYINNSIFTQLGYPPEFLTGKSVAPLLLKEDYVKIRSFLKKGNFSKISQKAYVSMIKNKNGEYVWFETNVLPLKNKDGVIDRIQCVSRNISDKIENEKKLEEERQNVLRAMIDGQELERQRISMELHDGLGQRLAGIKMKLENSAALNLEQTRISVNETKHEFWKMIDEIRMISNNVSPAILSQWGLVPSLSDLCNQFKCNSGIEFDFSVIGNFDNISEKTGFYIYRIVQEGLTNVAKHSEATLVKLAFIEKENNYLILIEDNGKGIIFEKNIPGKGNGLKNIKQRAMLLKGEVNIESEKGTGTVVWVRIPK